MSDELNLLPPETWTFTLAEFTTFLAGTKRYTSCPGCSYNGNWIFHVDGTEGLGRASPMLVFVIPGYKPSDLTKTHIRAGHFQMECPQCGLIACTSTTAVAKFFGRIPQGDQR